jgi:quinol monooxygenase YgiN
MSKDLFWVFTLSVREGKSAQFEHLVERIVDATRREPGTLAYQYSANNDKTVVHIFERYVDSDAFVAHVNETFSRFADEFLQCVSVERLVVYGDPSAEARAALDQFGAEYMTPFNGFLR